MPTAEKRVVAVKLDQDADETVVDAKTTGGKYHGLLASNIDNATYFVHLFDDLADDVTLGTTAPKYVVPIANGDGTKSGITFDEPPGTLRFATAISYAVKTVSTTAGTTGPTTDILLNLFYE